MEQMKIVYTVSRDEGLWIATTPGVAGGLAERTLPKLKQEIEKVTPFMHPGEDPEISYVYDLPVSYTEFQEAREALARQKVEHTKKQIKAINDLIASGVSERDAGELLGLSKQWVHKLKDAG
jgi:hypothetical protein